MEKGVCFVIEELGKRLSLMADLPGMAAVARGRDLGLLWCDRSYASLFDAEPEMLLGTPPASMTDGKPRPEAEVLTTGRPLDLVQLWRGRRCVSRCSPLHDPGLHAVALVSVLIVGTCAPAHEAAVFTPAIDPGERALLSPRELEVFFHLGRGGTARDIAHALFRSSKTVERHTESIFDKLRFSRRTDLVLWAAERGLTRFSAEQCAQIVAARGMRGGAA